ncbi:WD-repeat family protein [Cotonvirus japonicus]|uniref:WD-repeat family protein n=1 Tax=Cotonvirus japonicus TaxID=2811091 RepID=A0ABM7NRK4_9VIRU|nr:WD-repeat family protein [Cotonvirus japonicus]BCS82793.1 WD-repeat family protein [Cotonvirus japonicus]
MDNQQHILVVNLILTDENHSETLTLDKKILIEKCEYFSGMLTKFSEINSDTIRIKVIDSRISKNIIMSLFEDIDVYINIINEDYPDWKYLLLLYKCCDFFNIGFNVSHIYKLLVPSDGFDLLLDVIDLIGYDNNTIWLLNNNLPKDYDIRNFPTELLEAMRKQPTSYNIISGSFDRTIKLWNIQTQEFDAKIFTKLQKTLRYFPIRSESVFNNNITCMDYYHKHNQIISGSDYGVIKLWDLKNGEVLKELEHEFKIFDVCFSPNGKFCASASKELSIWNLNTGEQTLIFNSTRIKSKNCIKKCVRWTNDNIIVCGDSDGIVEFWDADTFLMIKWCQVFNGQISNIYFSPDRSQIAISHWSNIILYDSIFDRKILRIENAWEITGLAYSPTEDVIATIDSNCQIKLRNCRTGILFRSFPNNLLHSIKKLCFSSTGHQIIFACTSKNYEYMIGIWNWKLNDDIIYLKGHCNEITSLCIIPNDENFINERIMNTINGI